MPFRTQDYKCAEHGTFEELLSLPELTRDMLGQQSVPSTQTCPKCGADSPRILSVGMVNPQFVYFQRDTARR